MRIFITGIPGTGKTTIGNFLRDQFGYKHVNFEDGVSLNEFFQNPDNFIDLELKNDNSVISWGFVPDEVQIETVNYLKRDKGFSLVWFDGDRVSAFREYLKAGRPENLFYLQMFRIEESKVVERIKPLIINTFNNVGRFREKTEVVEEIERKLKG